MLRGRANEFESSQSLAGYDNLYERRYRSQHVVVGINHSSDHRPDQLFWDVDRLGQLADQLHHLAWSVVTQQPDSVGEGAQKLSTEYLPGRTSVNHISGEVTQDTRGLFGIPVPE